MAPGRVAGCRESRTCSPLVGNLMEPLGLPGFGFCPLSPPPGVQGFGVPSPAKTRWK